MWNEKRIVDGANDNLTGCYIGIAVLKALQDEGIELENTELAVVNCGSEELVSAAQRLGARRIRANGRTFPRSSSRTIQFMTRSILW